MPPAATLRDGAHEVFVRYQWSASTPTTALMQQAFSADGGRTWEVNWICELTRDKAG